jgi:hypothetical protein
MVEYSVFDKLVSRLSTSERRQMLDRIASAAPTAPPVVASEFDEETVDLDAIYLRMGPLRRLVAAIIAVLTGRDRMSVVEAQVARDLRRRAAARTSDFDSARDQLRPSAHAAFSELGKAARQFSGPLARVMGRERGPFTAFLAGLHAPDIQERLLEECDSFAISQKATDLSPTEVKRRAMLAMEEALVTLPAGVRQQIYTDVRTLHHLMTLSAFPFERLLAEFTPAGNAEPVAVSLTKVADALGRLASVLGGLRAAPSPLLFQALGLYQEQDRLEESDERVEGLIQRDMEAGTDAFGVISAFTARYPLADLVRIAHGNIHWRPVPVSGGEDWFAIWKSFWKDRIERVHRQYTYERQVDSLIADARTSLQLEDVHPFPGYPPSGLDQPARHGLSLGVLRNVFGNLYEKELREPLAVLHRDGEFYKADNRREFDELVREIDQLQTETANLEVRLRSGGDIGMNWARTLDTNLAPEAAEERQLAIARQVDADASALVRRAINAFRAVGEVLQGVLYGTVGGRYDSVSNLGRLGGGEEKGYTRKLENVHVRAKAVGELLAELINIESLSHA